MPFASGWVGEKLGLPKQTVWRSLEFLVDSGVLESRGHMPGRGGLRGTELFAPGVPQAHSLGVEPGDGSTIKPAGEVEDEPVVSRAEAVRGRAASGLGAPRHGAAGEAVEAVLHGVFAGDGIQPGGAEALA